MEGCERRGANRSCRLLARIGQVSYSMYIFHFLFVWYGSGLILPQFAAKFPSVAFATIFLVGTALTFFLAQATEALIERRGIAIGRRLSA